MRRLRVAPTGIALALVMLVGPAGHAGTTKQVVAKECFDQTAMVEVSSQQAQSYLPEGFRTGAGAAGQSAVPHLYIRTLACGSGTSRTLQVAMVYLVVTAPEASDAPDTVDYFILDMAAAGPSAPGLADRLCLMNSLKRAQIETVQEMETDDGDVSRGSSRVTSEDLDLSFSIATSGSEVTGGGGARWHFESGSGFDHFDSMHAESYISAGAGHVRFSKAYRDLPPIAPALAFYEFKAALVFSPSRACNG